MASDPAPGDGPQRRLALDAFTVAALETEHHVAAAGWDQPPRLFALVETTDLLRREPALAGSLGPLDRMPGALSAVEQDDLPGEGRIEDLLASVAWPEEVCGCLLAVERFVVPPAAEDDLPGDPQEALAHLAEHPDRADIRLVAAVLRDGRHTCLLRQRAHDHDDAVAVDPAIAPGLISALRSTLED